MLAVAVPVALPQEAGVCVILKLGISVVVTVVENVAVQPLLFVAVTRYTPADRFCGLAVKFPFDQTKPSLLFPVDTLMLPSACWHVLFV